MISPKRARRAMTADEFIAWEIEQTERHEFFRGEVFAMVGASRAHNLVALNLAVALHNRLDHGVCSVLSSAMKVHISAADAIFYPDVVVSCSPVDRQSTHALSEPCFIAEVLSASTGSFDKSAKFAAYRRVPTLGEYLLIEPHTRIVELFRRTAEGGWQVVEPGNDGTLALDALGVAFPIAELFFGLD
jgi:Uma2 family endonuclease